MRGPVRGAVADGAAPRRPFLCSQKRGGGARAVEGASIPLTGVAPRAGTPTGISRTSQGLNITAKKEVNDEHRHPED